MAGEWINDLFGRLDRALLGACDREERRAGLLAEGSGRGWDGVRNLLRPSVGALLRQTGDSAGAGPHGIAVAPLPPPLRRLQVAFSLAPVELDALVVLLAPHVEPRYRVLYGVLGDTTGEPWVTERVLLAVLGAAPADRHALVDSLAPSGRLRDTGLVTVATGQPPLAAAVDLAPEIRAALLGLTRPPAVEVIPLHWREGGAAPRPGQVFVVHGDGPRGEVLARVAGDAGHVVCGPIHDDERAGRVAQTLWRLGAVNGALPAVDLGAVDEVVGRRVVDQMTRRVQTWGGAMAFLCPRGVPLPIPHFEAPRPGFTARKAAWLDEARARGAALDDDAAARLAAAYRLDRARIRDAFDGAASGERGADADALAAQAVHLSSTRIPHGNAVRPRRGFDDIVLVDTTRDGLERLIFFVRNRDRVAEQRGLEHRFALQRGPVVLFSGRSGTGKTLAAEIVAGALGRPLHVVDLARLVSKYIGETEKNIDEVLAAGESAGAVLFFDEADALFSQRTEVSSSNDRFANLEVGYLLQRIETHDGMVVLSTNLRQSIDEAFLRRFHARVEFPLPGPDERRQIWQLMLPPGVPRAEDLAFDALGRDHELSGGDIRNAALKAIFLAEQEDVPVTQDHLARGVALELLELGRLSRRDGAGDADDGVRLRSFARALQRAVENRLRAVFLKEIHLVHGAPTKENLAGKWPAVSLALFRLAQPRSGGLRLGFVVSAWSNRAEEEHELLGVLHELLAGHRLAEIEAQNATLKVAESYDFDLLHRFWSSHGHPVRASLVVDAEITR